MANLQFDQAFLPKLKILPRIQSPLANRKISNSLWRLKGEEKAIYFLPNHLFYRRIRRQKDLKRYKHIFKYI
jgi:hypothetical protein